MLVHGPSNICTHPSSIPTDTFAFVLTGGKSKGCENGVDVGVGVGVAPEIFAALAKLGSMPISTVASTSGSKNLEPISEMWSPRCVEAHEHCCPRQYGDARHGGQALPWLQRSAFLRQIPRQFTVRVFIKFQKP
jgi:hypothetical protein